MSTLGDMLKYLPPRLAEAVAEESRRLVAYAGAADGRDIVYGGVAAAGRAVNGDFATDENPVTGSGAHGGGTANSAFERSGSANGTAAAGRSCFVTELRLRRELPCSLTLSDGQNLTLGVRATRSELSAVLARMTENSLHTHAATLGQGYIRLPDGSRVGVCGRAVSGRSNDDALPGIGEINSMCIRISHDICGVSDGIFGHLRRRRFEGGALLYGPPACGKTTLLRELAFRAASGDQPMRVALIDSRGELGGISGGGERRAAARCASDNRSRFADALIDRLDGYPKAEGIAQATRVLSPELIVCDEIGGEAEARAILEAQNTGVPLLASVHAPSYAALLRRPHIRELLEASVFAECIGIRRDDAAQGGLCFKVTALAGGYTEDAEHAASADRAADTDNARRVMAAKGGFSVPSGGTVLVSGVPHRRGR